MRGVRFLITGVLLGMAAACSGGGGGEANSTITIGGRTLVPRSAFVFTGSPDGYFDESVIAITDHPDACGEVPKMNACNLEAQLYTRHTIDAPAGVATALVLAARPGTPGTYGMTFNACYEGEPIARAAFQARGAGGFVDEAVSGTVRLEQAAPGAGAKGSYELVMRSGATVRGSFEAGYCPAVDRFTALPPARSGGTWGTNPIRDTATCAGVTLASSCSQPSPGADWSCSCTAADGTLSTCTVPVASAGAPVCSARPFTCCPMDFATTVR